MNSRTMLRAGALMGGLAVAAGAFGAHALESTVSSEDLVIFETDAQYQMYHAMALILCGFIARGASLAAHAFLWGTVVFSGSLYLLVLTDARWFGAITPIGGTLLIVGWVALALRARASEVSLST